MAKYVIEDTTLTGIADAIREKNGSTDTYKPEDMPSAIDAIETSNGSGGMLVKPKSVQFSRVDGYAKYGKTLYYNASTSMSRYYWYRANYNNLYWEVCGIKTAFVEGHTYRVSAWIWHDGSANNEPIPFWQPNIFINSNTSVNNPLTEITTTPQLLTTTFTYTTDTVYGTVFYLYPEASDNQVRLTPLLFEDLSSPETGVEAITVQEEYMEEELVIELPEVVAEIETREDGTCLLTINTETYEGRLEGDSIVFYDCAIGGGLMYFLGHNTGNWVIGETTYTQAIMDPCSIVEGRMVAPKLVFSK